MEYQAGDYQLPTPWSDDDILRILSEVSIGAVVAHEMKREAAETVVEVLPMEAELERAMIEDRSLDEIREIMARRTAPK